MRTRMQDHVLWRGFGKAVLAVWLILGWGCAPRQTTFRAADLQDIRSISLEVTSSNVKVNYSHAGDDPGVEWLLLPGWYITTGEVVQMAQDGSLSAQASEGFSRPAAEAALRKAFREELTGNSKLTVAGDSDGPGPEAHVSLHIEQISLNRTAGDLVRLAVKVHGEMHASKDGRELWRRDDSSESGQAYPLDYFRQNGEMELEKVLTRIGKRLAAEIVYAM
jgi:hypothetical protein